MKYLIAWCLAGCATVAPPPEPPPPPAVHTDPTDPCARACMRLRELGCPEGSPPGDTCEAQCVAIEQSGIASVHPECLARLASCDALDRCAS